MVRGCFRCQGRLARATAPNALPSYSPGAGGATLDNPTEADFDDEFLDPLTALSGEPEKLSTRTSGFGMDPLVNRETNARNPSERGTCLWPS